MNPSPARATTRPAPTGRDHAAPTKRQVAPFAMLPHDVAADSRLTPTDLRVLAALLYYACSKPTCYPSDAGIADRVHRHPGTVRRCLKRLEELGYIRREFVPATPANPTGRLIHLSFTAPGWARPEVTPERRCAPTPARCCAPTPCAAARAPRAPAPVSPRAPAHTEPEVVIVEGEELSEEPQVTDPVLRSRPTDFQAQLAPPVTPAAMPAVTPPAPPVVAPPVADCATAPAAGTVPFDLRAIGHAPELRVPPAPMVPARRRSRLGLSLEELATVAGDDPILAAELARRTAPPAPPEPPPQTLPTVELFELLPGRHDLIMVAARRLSEETGDFQVASLWTFEKMAEAVATRLVPSAVLIDCWRQGTGPKAEHKGKMLVAAWKREASLCC